MKAKLSPCDRTCNEQYIKRSRVRLIANIPYGGMCGNHEYVSRKSSYAKIHLSLTYEAVLDRPMITQMNIDIACTAGRMVLCYGSDRTQN